MKKLLYIGTRNPGKLREYRAILDSLQSDSSRWAFPEIDKLAEPVESGATFRDNAELKARYYAKAMQGLALAEDSGIVVPELSGLPGIYSARFSDCEFDISTGELLTWTPSGAARADLDKKNNLKLLELLEGKTGSARRAYYTAHIAVSRDCGEIVYSKEFVFEGRVVQRARGSKGFGYDSIFEPVDTPGRLASEISTEEKNSLSHRGKGAKDLKLWIESFR
jgi:XTP/dITP diphosphohydrolase